MALENTGVMDQLEITGLYGNHKNDGFVGVQSLRNETTYELRYDPEKEDFVVGRMVPNPRFR